MRSLSQARFGASIAHDAGAGSTLLRHLGSELGLRYRDGLNAPFPKSFAALIERLETALDALPAVRRDDFSPAGGPVDKPRR